MSKNYTKLHPDQARAKWLVSKHVKRGHIVKPERCQICGEPVPAGKLQAHHHNYEEPLNVSWYCDACHKAVHKELKKDKKGFQNSS